MPKAAEKEQVEEVKVEKKESDLVWVKLPKDREHQDDYYVCLNGKTFLIQRGKEVQVPAAVAKIIENQERMDALALERSEKASHKFA